MLVGNSRRIDQETSTSIRGSTVVVVMGTRPEAVKLAPVVWALTARPWARCQLLATGQHPVASLGLDVLGLQPDIDLGLEAGSRSLAGFYAHLVSGIDDALQNLRPDLVIVQGDTASAMAGAWAGFLRGVPVVHVEAGLRTGDLAAPFPEEANRRAVTQVAALNLAPTPQAEANLLAEGIRPERVLVTGNTVTDAFRAVSRRPPTSGGPPRPGARPGHPTVVVTAHRRESWGEPIRRIGRAVATLAGRFPDHDFVVIAHPNPAARHALLSQVGAAPNVTASEPLRYDAMARLIGGAALVITDSGGIQEEAPSVGVPVLVTRDVTERVEGVEAGTARLVGTDEQEIVAQATRLLTNPHAHRTMASADNPYGDGQAGPRVAAACAWLLGIEPRPASFRPPPIFDADAAVAVGA